MRCSFLISTGSGGGLSCALLHASGVLLEELSGRLIGSRVESRSIVSVASGVRCGLVGGRLGQSWQILGEASRSCGPPDVTGDCLRERQLCRYDDGMGCGAPRQPEFDHQMVVAA